MIAPEACNTRRLPTGFGEIIHLRVPHGTAAADIMRRMTSAVYFAMWMTALLISAIFHEQWHARVALWLGDPTAKAENRLSWNPRYHIDPFMSILLPLMLYFTTGTAFGGAKPVRVNPMDFRHPMLGNALVAAAGPISNLFLALLTFGILALLWVADKGALYDGERATFNAVFLFIFLFTNVLLAAFNILPFPGLDGSRILYLFLPRAGRALLDAVEPYALLVTFMLIRVGAGNILAPVYRLLFALIRGVFGDEFLAAVGRALAGQ